ncbi:MAG: hypothetical protein GY694_05040 [Gammaproteobacteria bacterium]|nr:hypothetical protein [Gammaproteobacteria bacterium]
MDAQFPSPPLGENTSQSAKNLTNLIYLLQAFAVFTAVPFFIAVIINYVKKEDVRGTLAESHFRWQIRTFWFSLLWGIIGGILAYVLVGFGILFINFIWVIYRIVKGWMNLNDNKAMYQE